MDARLSKMVIDQTERENRCDASLALIPPGPDADPVVGANELSEVMKTANPLKKDMDIVFIREPCIERGRAIKKPQSQYVLQFIPQHKGH